MNKGIFLSFGTNLGDRRKNLETATRLIRGTLGAINALSSVFRTAAWGNTAQPDFFNQVLAIETALDPFQLLEKLQSVEQSIGRVREERWGPRIIDIDMLFYQDRIIDTAVLRLPHPEIPYRRFVLQPLSEIAPDFIHPVLKKNIRTLLSECPDTLEVEKIL